MMKEKRENTEKVLESQPKQQAESIEDRRNRLKAQRDLLVKQKADKRAKELGEFNDKTANKEDLHKELLDIDSKIRAKEQFKQGQSSYS